MSYSLDTRCIHGEGNLDNDENKALSFPIYQTASFSHIKPGHNENGYDYTRESNPTRSQVEKVVASLEKAVDTTAFCSGMAAISTCFELFSPGDHIICAQDLYGGTVRFFHDIVKKNNLTIDFVDTTDIDAIASAITQYTKAIYIETPTNPMMHITDIAACAQIAHKHNAYLIVDNTFLSPYFQNPLLLGADIVIHSGSKFLGGHNDAISGFVCTADRTIGEKIRNIAKTVGNTLAPFDSWLILRGIKTLAIRMQRQQETGYEVAQWLAQQPWVNHVYHPGFTNHPGYKINACQARGSGSVFSFTVINKEIALRILTHVRLITFAESLGGTESLITYPMLQTHADVPEKMREHLGIIDTLLRLSIGLEDAKDLISDFEAAAKK